MPARFRKVRNSPSSTERRGNSVIPAMSRHGDRLTSRITECHPAVELEGARCAIGALAGTRAVSEIELVRVARPHARARHVSVPEV